MLAGRRSLASFRVELLQFLQFYSCVLQLMPVFNAHGLTSTIPLATKFRSVATLRPLPGYCGRPSTATVGNGTAPPIPPLKEQNRILAIRNRRTYHAAT